MQDETQCWFNSNLDIINSFAELKKNWDGEDALEIEPEIIAASIRFLKLLCCICIQERPYVFPTKHGTILFEWFGKDNIGCGEIEIKGEDSCEFYFDENIKENKIG
jgi:hypothetical protein